MNVNTENLVSISEANQNFSRVARLVDAHGAAVILRNNVPKYVLIDFREFQKEETADTNNVELIGRRILMKHRHAFERLAE